MKVRKHKIETKMETTGRGKSWSFCQKERKNASKEYQRREGGQGLLGKTSKESRGG